ncbi:MAG: hypothetical protein ACE5LC_10970 [Candidatus Aminicenantales bacterium]
MTLTLLTGTQMFILLRHSRTDYILSTPKLMEKTSSLEVDLWPRKRRKPPPSDHAPLVAVLEL